ncbi:hypothetical protein, partial [Bacillus cereus group sp. Bcc03]|uniref:hypothetical protein n=1 Tax=Bacillus cereus group sp. Bcc03 TaxID=3018100 RepID=UPI0022E685E9
PSCKLTRGGPRRAVFARWGYLWEFEGVEARGQVNRGIKSVGRDRRKGQKSKDILEFKIKDLK